MLSLFTLYFSHIDVKVYFHGRDQFLDISGRMGYKVYIGQRIQSQITVQAILQLDYKNTRTGMFLGIFLSENDKKCSHDSYDKCMYNTLARIMRAETEDHCTVPWILDNENICSIGSDIDKSFWISWNRITNQKKDCLSPCHTTLMNVGAKNQRKYNDKFFAQMDVYFSSHVMKSEEHYYYTVIKLLAQIGGYVGLFRLSMFLLDFFRVTKLRQDDKVKSKIKTRIGSRKKKNADEIVMADEHLINLSTLAINNL